MTILDIEALVASRWHGPSPSGWSARAAPWFTVRSLRPPLHIAIRTAGIFDDTRHAALAKEWSSKVFSLPPYAQSLKYGVRFSNKFVLN